MEAKLILYHGSANDKTTRIIALYIAGVISANEAIERLRFNQINNQVSLHTPSALLHLKMIEKQQYEQ
jgi:hypothetical protein